MAIAIDATVHAVPHLILPALLELVHIILIVRISNCLLLSLPQYVVDVDVGGLARGVEMALAALHFYI